MDFVVSESLQKEVLDSLKLYIKRNKPVLLSGSVGSGKSSLLHHVAALSGRKPPLQLLTIQLSRDLDSKVRKSSRTFNLIFIYSKLFSNDISFTCVDSLGIVSLHSSRSGISVGAWTSYHGLGNFIS